MCLGSALVCVLYEVGGWQTVTEGGLSIYIEMTFAAIVYYSDGFCASPSPSETPNSQDGESSRVDFMHASKLSQEVWIYYACRHYPFQLRSDVGIASR